MSRAFSRLARLAAVAAAVYCGTGAAARLHAFVSVLPLRTFVEQVGGERVNVRSLVQPGQSPASYEPTPRQMAAVSRADVFFRVGVPFEAAWMDRIRRANPQMTVVDLRQGVALRPIGEHHHDDDQDGGAGETNAGPAMDPHVWTDPTRAAVMVETIGATLTRLDPDGSAGYRSRADAYKRELQRLDTEIRQRLAGLRHRRFLVYHPSWGYFADAYGLEQIAIEREGKEPGPRSLAAVIDQARREDIRTVFVQSQFSRHSAEAVARAIDGRVVQVDPLSADYAANLRRVAEALAGAMR
jgi:zinc transport system substrate-binding protein